MPADLGGHSRLLWCVGLVLVVGILCVSYRDGSPLDFSDHVSVTLDDGSKERVQIDKSKKKILLTGGAGFIGSHSAEYLLRRGDDIIVVDEINDYYNVSLKRHNLVLLQHIVDTVNGAGKLEIHERDICEEEYMKSIFDTHLQKGEPITHILHMAARAGVRPSILNPHVYVHSNIEGSLVMLELARKYQVKNYVFASSSSVYGENKKIPFSETDDVSNPVSPYAATKRAAEIMATTYNNLYNIPMSGLRFFTVYGPRGRPDMAPYQFIDKIYRGEEINKYGDGSTSRDYTYIDDIVQGIVAALDRPFKKLQLFNLGGATPVSLDEFIAAVEKAVSRSAHINNMPPQPGDVPRTFADVTKSAKLLGYAPQFDLAAGLQRTADWYSAAYHPEPILQK